MKKAFTLAEVMITLVVIGVITAIVMPIVANSAPDKNVMKFKKADTTLKNVIRELVNSDQYYKDGDLGLKPDGSYTGRSYFCNSFADMLSAKKINCNYNYSASIENANYIALAFIDQNGRYTEAYLSANKTYADQYCKEAEASYTGKDVGIETSDGIHYFEASLDMNFGCILKDTCEFNPWPESSYYIPRMYNGERDIFQFPNGIKVNRFYRIFCIDIDRINEGEDPFGYGIRVDGKILNGARADEWLEKDFNGKDPSEQ